MRLSRPAPALALAASMLILPGNADPGRASSPDGGGGGGAAVSMAQAALLGPADVGGLSAKPVSAAPWLALAHAAIPATVAAARTLQTTGAPALQVVSRAAVATGAGPAEKLLHAARAISRSSLDRVDAAALGVAPAALARAQRVTWRSGRIVGELTYVDSSGAWGPQLLQQLVRELQARSARLEPPTVGDRLLAQAARGPVGVKTALAAFALEFGAVPGIVPPGGPLGTLPSRTAVLAWIAADRRQLTAGQRTAVTRVLQRLFGGGAAKSRSSSVRTTASDRASTPSCAEPYAGSNPPAGPPIDDQDCAILRKATEYFRKKLGLVGPPLRQVLIAEATPPAIPGEEANTPPPIGVLGFPSYCKTSIAPAIRAGDATDRAYVIAHEAFHCAMFQKVGAVGYKWAPLWVGEGGTVWAGCQFMADSGLGTPKTAETHYHNYLYQPTQPIDDAWDGGYAGVGFFSLLAHVGIDPFERLPLMYAVGYSSQLAYQAAVRSDDQAVVDDWAASYYDDARGSGDWRADGFCRPARPPVPTKPLIVAVGSRQDLEVPPFANAPYVLESRAPLLHVSVSRGDVRISGRNGVDDKHVSDAYYCTAAGGCGCAGSEVKQLPPSSIPFVAISGGEAGARVTIEGSQCPLITHATYVVSGASLSWLVNGCLSHATLDWAVTWDLQPALALKPGATASVFPEAGAAAHGTVTGSGTYTRSDCGPAAPACSTSLVVVPRSATPTLSVVTQQGAGRTASWVLSFAMVAEGNIAYFPDGACTPVPFDDFAPADEDLETVSHVTLPASGGSQEHTETLTGTPFEPAVGSGSATLQQSWSARITVTGTF